MYQIMPLAAGALAAILLCCTGDTAMPLHLWPANTARTHCCCSHTCTGPLSGPSHCSTCTGTLPTTIFYVWVFSISLGASVTGYSAVSQALGVLQQILAVPSWSHFRQRPQSARHQVPRASCAHVRHLPQVGSQCPRCSWLTAAGRALPENAVAGRCVPSDSLWRQGSLCVVGVVCWKLRRRRCAIETEVHYLSSVEIEGTRSSCGSVCSSWTGGAITACRPQAIFQ